MAGRKKKAAKKSTKRKAKTVARKSKRVAKKSTRRAAARKAPARKMKAAKRPARKKVARGEYGEGNYKATKRFRKSEEAFIERNRQNIPAMGREAETALEGPEGPALIEAENEARSRAAE
jgi:hypothetical protein